MARAEEREVLEELREMGLSNVDRKETLNDQYMDVDTKSLDELFEYVDYEHRDKDIRPNQSNQRGGLRRRRIPFITGRFKGRAPKPNDLQALASILLFGKRTPTLKHRPHKKARPSYGRPKPFHATHKNKKRPIYKNTQPTYHKPKQNYVQPKPTSYKPHSSYEQPKPTYHKIGQVMNNPNQPTPSLSQVMKNPNQQTTSLSQLMNNPNQPTTKLNQVMDNPNHITISCSQVMNNPNQASVNV
jgi:hypothetical protein